MVVDGQRAHVRGRLRRAVTDVRLLADEVLVLDLAPGHAGLDDVEVRLELGAVGAVGLLQAPGGAVDADPGRDDPMRGPASRDDVPQPRALLDRDVQLPAELTDVGDPRREHLAAAPSRSSGSVANGNPSCETSSLVSAARMSRARGPHSAERRVRRRLVVQLTPSRRRADGRRTTSCPSRRERRR